MKFQNESDQQHIEAYSWINIRYPYKNIPVLYFAVNRCLMQVYTHLFTIWG